MGVRRAGGGPIFRACIAGISRHPWCIDTVYRYFSACPENSFGTQSVVLRDFDNFASECVQGWTNEWASEHAWKHTKREPRRLASCLLTLASRKARAAACRLCKNKHNRSSAGQTSYSCLLEMLMTRVSPRSLDTNEKFLPVKLTILPYRNFRTVAFRISNSFPSTLFLYCVVYQLQFCSDI